MALNPGIPGGVPGLDWRRFFSETGNTGISRTAAPFSAHMFIVHCSFAQSMRGAG